MPAVPLKTLAGILLALGLQAGFWWQTHDIRVGWRGVPAVPSHDVALALAFGDGQLFYRTVTFRLQNMGDEGGRVTPLEDYDYRRLTRWFRLLDDFDSRSRYLPVLVGHYFSQSQDAADVRAVIEYLREIAVREPARNWRWLAHAVYLARHRVGDMDLALELARELAALDVEGLPVWTRQMPAFVLAEVGEKEAARDLLEAIMASDPNLSPAEIRFMRNYIDARLK